ncbi:ferrous iron transport protein A [bacterium]|nr:ferrous iron transport protein A [bacterium]
MMPLGLFMSGERGEVLEIKANAAELQAGAECREKEKSHCHAENMGIRNGKVVEVLRNEGSGPMLIKVDESRIALARGMAMKIFLRRI